MQIKLLIALGILFLSGCESRTKTKALCSGENCYIYVQKSKNGGARNMNYLIYSSHDNYFYNDKKTYGVNFREASVGGGGIIYISFFTSLIYIPHAFIDSSSCDNKMIFKGIFTNQQYLGKHYNFDKIRTEFVVNNIIYKGHSIITKQEEKFPEFEFIFQIACNSYDEATLTIDEVYIDGIKQSSIKINLEKKELIFYDSELPDTKSLPNHY